MEKVKLDKAYWDSRYQSDNIGWDIGYISPAIKNWFDIQENKDLKYLLLGVDMNRKTIYRLIEIATSETRTTLTLKNLKTNTILSPDFFTFDGSKYPDYYIND